VTWYFCEMVAASNVALADWTEGARPRAAATPAATRATITTNAPSSPSRFLDIFPSWSTMIRPQSESRLSDARLSASSA
jgi:hypothetical protein